MKTERCGGKENKPDPQASVTTTVQTEDGCEGVHVNMGTGAVTYSPAKGGCGCGSEKKAEGK